MLSVHACWPRLGVTREALDPTSSMGSHRAKSGPGAEPRQPRRIRILAGRRAIEAREVGRSLDGERRAGPRPGLSLADMFNLTAFSTGMLGGQDKFAAFARRPLDLQDKFAAFARHPLDLQDNFAAFARRPLDVHDKFAAFARDPLGAQGNLGPSLARSPRRARRSRTPRRASARLEARLGARVKFRPPSRAPLRARLRRGAARRAHVCGRVREAPARYAASARRV